MNHLPIFSIIIPTLNEEYYLPILLNALVKQTERRFEIIICDGKSSDATISVAKKYTKAFQTLTILSSPKRNVAFQRNLAAKHAKGVYLIFFDADVTTDPDFLEKIAKIIEKKRAKFLTTWLKIESKNIVWKVFLCYCNILVSCLTMLRRPLAGGLNTIIERVVFLRSGGFREDLTIAEDYDFTLRLFADGINLTVVKDPRVMMSLRRYKSQGNVWVMWQYIYCNIYTWILGHVPNHVPFEYPMGGHVHRYPMNKLI